MSHQREAVAKETNLGLSHTEGVSSIRCGRCLSMALQRHHQCHKIWDWVSRSEEDTGILESVQKKTTRRDLRNVRRD